MAPHLLSLPGEIRNRIYKFALTEERGVCYKKDIRDVGRLCQQDTPRLSIANQLQFVCRQMRNEAKGLGLRYNTIYFIAKEDRNQLCQCASFLRSLPEIQKKYIQKLFIHHTGGWNFDNQVISELFQFCKTHPKSSIIIVSRVTTSWHS